MKSILAATIVMLLVVSPALGFGTSASQSNMQTASGNGIGTIDQTASNAGLIIGDFNNVMQSNGQDATLNAAQSSIEQISANNVLVAGFGNWVNQGNLASATTYGYGNLIKQTQDNIGMVMGMGNSLQQSNDADATIDSSWTYSWYLDALADASATATARADNPYTYTSTYADATEIQGDAYSSYYYPVILQDQDNRAVQIGNWNCLVQSNEADAGITARYTIIGEAAADAEADAISEGVATYPGNGADVYAIASADADASMSAVGTFGPTTISQTQANLGMQIGNSNYMNQRNDADARINSEVRAVAVADSVADAFTDLYEEMPYQAYLRACPECWARATATATASANANLESLSIDQDQSNNGMQIGAWNSMDQSNNALASISASVVADSRTMADANALADGTDTVVGYCARAESDAIASANAVGIAELAAQTIDQDQTNAGAQIGMGNRMIQSNDANAQIDLAAIETADLSIAADAQATGVADYWAADAYASASVSADQRAYIGPNTLTQSQSSAGLQVGAWNTLVQTNDADTLVDNFHGNSNAYIDLTSTHIVNNPNAAASATATGSASVIVSMNYAGENLVTQTQNNVAAMLGSFDYAQQTNDADATPLGLESIDEIQNNFALVLN